jgi:hypothetical protein
VSYLGRLKSLLKRVQHAQVQSGSAAAPATAALSVTSPATAGMAPQSSSIQDDEGRLRWMWGVSEWTEDGGDVFCDDDSGES